MRYNEAMNFDDEKPEMVKAEKKKGKDESRVLAGSKDYDYSSLSSTKKILTNNGRI